MMFMTLMFWWCVAIIGGTAFGSWHNNLPAGVFAFSILIILIGIGYSIDGLKP